MGEAKAVGQREAEFLTQRAQRAQSGTEKEKFRMQNSESKRRKSEIRNQNAENRKLKAES
jgi:hypothetical protein